MYKSSLSGFSACVLFLTLITFTRHAPAQSPPFGQPGIDAPPFGIPAPHSQTQQWATSPSTVRAGEFPNSGTAVDHSDFRVAGATADAFAFDCDGNCACDCHASLRYAYQCTLCSQRPGIFSGGIGGLFFGGWVEQGATFNFSGPSDRRNTPVRFNDRSNDYMLNQLYLYAESPVRNDGSQWDVGGRIDAVFGTDSRFVTVPGLERHRDRTPKWNGESRLYGLAIPQAYVEVAAPWLNGVSLKAGHFYSIAGYETVAAPYNFFYSHSYALLYGEPFTHTGALFTVKPRQGLTLNLGYTNGWDIWDSVSNEYGILAGLTLSSADQRTALAATVHSGTDVTSFRSGNTLTDEGRHFYSIVFRHYLNDCLQYVFQHDFGYQEDGRVVVNTGPRTITFGSAKWYGVNQYLIYDLSETTSAALRVEWFRDQNHSRLAVPVVFNPGGPTFTGGNYVGVTAGLNWRPNSNITVRPELRWDYADLRGNPATPGGNAAIRAFDDRTHSSQITAACDVILFY